jgi:hypothetical protein
MSSASVVEPVERLRGSERPRVLTAPPSVSSAGDEISDYAERFGLDLFAWQRFVLRTAMGEREDGRWSAGAVGLVVPRQNGKGSVLEARELAGLFLLGETITHTAHEFKTAMDAFRRLRSIIEASPELSRRVSIIKAPNPTIEVKPEFGRGRLMFIARSGGSGRGFSGDLIILDEAYDLTQDEMDALLPTLTTSPNMQIWYTSSAGKAHSEVLARLRQRGMAGGSRLAYMEWSVAEPGPDDPPLDPDDRKLIAQANPSYPLFPDDDYLEVEAGELSLQGRLRERLGIFDPVLGVGMFDMDVWNGPKCLDKTSRIAGRVSLAVEVAQDQSWACIAAAGPREDGRIHVQVAEYRPGTDWIAEKVRELSPDGRRSVTLSPNTPAGGLIETLRKAGIKVNETAASDYPKACASFFTRYRENGLRHLGQPELDTSVRGAARRQSGDAWVFDRRSPDLDISPLAACALALHEAVAGPPKNAGKGRAIALT